MSDKRPGDSNPTHKPAPPRPGPPPYLRRPGPDGRPAPFPPQADRRPAMHPTTGERPKRRTPPNERPVPGNAIKRTRPPGPPSRNPDGHTRRRPEQDEREGRDFLAPDEAPNADSDSPPPRRRARRRTQFAAFNIVMIVIIAMISLTVFAMSFESIFAGDREVAAPTPTPIPTPTPLPIYARNLTGIVTGLNDDVTPRTITMMDINTNQTREFFFLDTTSLVNRTGLSMPFSMLVVGNMMEVAYNPDNNELLDLRQSFTRDFHSRTGVRIDMENASITLGNDVLNFTSQTLILYRGAPAVLSDITEDDIITIVAVGDTIWLIQIESSHGFLEITNANTIINGRIIMDLVGSGIQRAMNLADISASLLLQEGTYRITVEGTNIENYVTEISIHHGETTILDLSNVEPGVAVLELTVTPAGSSVFINGELRADFREPMEFDFGQTLTIRAEREGYVTQERTVEMSQLTTTATINLEVEIITSLATILTDPIGANVWINNIPFGQSPVIAELAPGSHNITAQIHGFYDLSAIIVVSEDTSFHNLTMTPLTPEQPPYTPEEYTPEPPPYQHQPDPPPYSGHEDGDY